MALLYTGEWEIESIESDVIKNGIKYYMVKWVHFTADYNALEPASKVMDAYPAMVDMYETGKLMHAMAELQMQQAADQNGDVTMMMDYH